MFLGCASFYSGQKRICEELVSLQNPLVLRLEDSSFRSQSSFRESKLDNCVSMLNHRMLAVLRLYSERAAQLLVMLLANIEPKEVQVCSSVLSYLQYFVYRRSQVQSPNRAGKKNSCLKSLRVIVSVGCDELKTAPYS